MAFRHRGFILHCDLSAVYVANDTDLSLDGLLDFSFPSLAVPTAFVLESPPFEGPLLFLRPLIALFIWCGVHQRPPTSMNQI